MMMIIIKFIMLFLFIYQIYIINLRNSNTGSFASIIMIELEIYLRDEYRILIGLLI